MRSNVSRKAALKAKRGVIEAWGRARPSFKVKVGSRQIHVRASTGAGIGWLLSWEPSWKSHLVGAYLQQHPGLFVNVGANIGQTLLDYCASPHGVGYVGFEPLANCVDHLRRIVKDNQLVSCTVVPVALAAENRPLSFFSVDSVDSADPGASLLNDIAPLKQQERLIVPAYRFDDIVADVTGDRRIALIKIDVEGAEHLVLEGMADTLHRHRYPVLCEVLHRDPHADRDIHQRRTAVLMTMLKRSGYKVARIDKSADGRSVIGLTPIEQFPELVYARENADQCDYLFQSDQESWPAL